MEVREQEDTGDPEQTNSFNVKTQPSTHGLVSEVSSPVLVHEMVKVASLCTLLLVGSDGDEALKSGGEVGIDGRATDGIVAESINCGLHGKFGSE